MFTPVVVDGAGDDLGHAFEHVEAVAVDQGDQGIGVALDEGDHLRVDDHRLVIDSGEVDHLEQ
jgi:hypothetical protein